jgi:hypothetical protein
LIKVLQKRLHRRSVHQLKDKVVRTTALSGRDPKHVVTSLTKPFDVKRTMEGVSPFNGDWFVVDMNTNTQRPITELLAIVVMVTVQLYFKIKPLQQYWMYLLVQLEGMFAVCYPVRQFEWSEECTVSQGEGQPQHLVGILGIVAPIHGCR